MVVHVADLTVSSIMMFVLVVYEPEKGTKARPQSWFSTTRSLVVSLVVNQWLVWWLVLVCFSLVV